MVLDVRDPDLDVPSHVDFERFPKTPRGMLCEPWVPSNDRFERRMNLSTPWVRRRPLVSSSAVVRLLRRPVEKRVF